LMPILMPAPVQLSARRCYRQPRLNSLRRGTAMPTR